MNKVSTAQMNLARRADLVLLTILGLLIGLASIFWPWKVLAVFGGLAIVVVYLIVFGILWLMWPNKNGETIIDRIILSAMVLLFLWIIVFPLMKQEEEFTERLKADSNLK